MGQRSADYDWKRYRPELDGIRALAVICVLLFHAEVSAFNGGFIGVDVFFVLSGFLITGLLVQEIKDTARVSLVSFYARRGRRLIPAATLTLLVVSLVWLATTSYIERAPLISDARSSALYFSNWHFSLQATDYFAQTNAPSPFVHFWSLSAEEQFYFVWPALIACTVWLRCRFNRRSESLRSSIVWIICTAVSLSLLSLSSLIIKWPGSTQPWSYFGTHARTYQLLSGAVLAGVLHLKGPPAPRRLFHYSLLMGLAALVVLSTRWIRLTPELRGLLATAGSLVVLISLTTANTINRRPSAWSRLVPWFGRHSYSIYLWHWPVLLVLRRYGKYPPIINAMCCIFISLLLALVSSRFVENRIRYPRGPRQHPATTVAIGLLASVALGTIALPFLLSRETRPLIGSHPTPTAGLPPTTTDAKPNLPQLNAVETTATVQPTTTAPRVERMPDPEAIKNATKSAPSSEWNCAGAARLCKIHDGNAFTVVVIGDSHLLAWLDDFVDIARHHNFTLYSSLVFVCPWQPNVVPEGKNAEACQRHHEALYGTALRNLHPDLVITVTRAYDDPNYSRPLFNVRAPADHNPSSVLAAAMPESVATLLSVTNKLVIVRPWPTFAFHPRRCLAEATTVAQCGTSYIRPLPSEQILAQLAATEPRVEVVDLIPEICPTGPICLPVVNGVVSRFDNDHLTYKFALALEPALEAALNKVNAFAP